MAGKHHSKANRTKESILLAAQKLFESKGFRSVTMREIAKKAGCSHTAIYVYFKDKAALLERIAVPALEKVYVEWTQYLDNEERERFSGIHQLCRAFITFGIQNRTMYAVYFTAGAERVDSDSPELDVNKSRMKIFQLLGKAVQQSLGITNNEEILRVSRIIFFQLHGTIMTYTDSAEDAPSILERVLPVNALAIELIVTNYDSSQ